MSETPYLLVTLLLLRQLDRPRPMASRAGACFLALTQLRPAGLALLPAAAAPFARKPRARDAAWLFAPAGLAGAAWILWSRRAAGSVQELDELRLSYPSPGLAGPLSTAFDNARYYADALGAAFLPRRWAETPASVWFGGALLACAAWGVATALRKRRDDPAAWALAGTAGMHAVWAWQYERYWIPALPLLWWACALAWGRAARPLLAGLLAAVVAFSVPAWVAGTSWRVPELARTYAWISANTPPSEGLASAEFVRDGFYAGRPSAPIPDETDAPGFARRLRSRRIRYVLWQERLDVGVSPRHELRRRIERAGRHLEDRSLFALVHAETAEGGRVYVLK
jgi:hypothetical protein